MHKVLSKGALNLKVYKIASLHLHGLRQSVDKWPKFKEIGTKKKIKLAKVVAKEKKS